MQLGLIAFGLLATVNAMLWTGSTTLYVIGSDLRAFCWLDAKDRRGEPIGAVAARDRAAARARTHSRTFFIS